MVNSSSKTIATNTFFMFFRMALITIVGLYSSRVILNALGVVDFGIYNVAGSVVAIFAFLNGALGNSSSRFITIELGRREGQSIDRLAHCFKTTRGIHAILALFIVVIAETVGLWILYTKCEIPIDRLGAAMWVYQISIFTTVLSITFVPYNALIIAHERMNIYAFVGIVDAILKLAVCYLIYVSPIDKLVFYAFLILCIQVFDNLFCRIYCKRHFEECSFKYSFDKEFFKPILSFTGWNLLGSFSTMAMTQASTIMVSFFFGPAIVAARAISGQLRSYILNFINNFRVAVNPQILKRYAFGDSEGSKRLMFLSTSVSFYLMLFIVVPLSLETEYILTLWLKNVPEYAVEFTRITLLELMVVVYDVSFYMIFQATGRLRENALICPLMDIVAFVIVFFVYTFGGSPLTIGWTLVLLTATQGMIVKPAIAVRFFGYKPKDFAMIFTRNILVVALSVVIPFLILTLAPSSNAVNIGIVFISLFCVAISIITVGLSTNERYVIIGILSSFIKRK